MHTDNRFEIDKALKDCSLLLVLTALIYLPFLGLPAWDGNEPLRVIIAREMLRTGDWIIPVLHGKPYFTKPPMMNWLIAGSGALFGYVDEWTSRIPSVFLVFATSVSLYFLTGRWLRRDGRLFAAMGAVCMIGLIKKGRTAEIDTLFVFFVAVMLLTWLNGYVRQWRPALLWSLSLLLVGLGFLTKGPQIIAYFYLTVFSFLLIRRRISFFFSKEHLLGGLFFVLVLGVYLFFVLQHISPENYANMWISQIADRAESASSFAFFEHLLLYPLEGLLSFMPWMLLIIPVVASGDLRMRTRELSRNDLFVFSLVMIMANFPLYWLLPNARFRYFLPAGPFVAIAIAFLFEMYIERAGERAVKRFVKGILVFCSLIALISAAGLIAAHFFLGKAAPVSFGPSLLALLGSVFLLGAYIMRKRDSIPIRQAPLYMALTTGLLFITYADIDARFDASRVNNPREIAEKIDNTLPDDVNRVYEVGYRRFLGITCYLNRRVIQADEFSDLEPLESMGGKVFFLFDTKYLDTRESRRRELNEIPWVKVYSQFLEKSRGEIVLGQLREPRYMPVTERDRGSDVPPPNVSSP